MKVSNKDLSSLADTTKATTIKIGDINEENVFNEEIQEEARSHPMALVIEDDKPSEVNVISELKKKNFLYKTAKTVSEGIEVYKTLDKQGIKIDVLFLDIVLKDKSSGIEFLKTIRANHWMENTFIIVMSSLEDSKVVNECYKYQIENFLHKPIKKKEFQIEERKIFNHLRKIKCPIDGYSVVKLLDKTQNKESHLVRCEKTKELFLLKKIYCPSNEILTKHQDLLNETNNDYSSTIIKLITSKILNKCNYLIIEYSEFGSLSKKILEKKEELNQERYLKEDSVKNYKQMFDTEQILLWMSEIIFALYSLHEKEIMHKDIKIENIYIFNDKLVKIKNLYLVRISEEPKNEFNSLIYMPPEMFSFQEYSCYTDIWDLGIVLYELVMLEKPFQGINSDEIKNNIINEKYTPFPDNIDIRLKRLLELTLAFINHRASAARLLELKFIREKIDYLYNNKIIKGDELYKKISSLPIRDNDYKFYIEPDNECLPDCNLDNKYYTEIEVDTSNTKYLCHGTCDKYYLVNEDPNIIARKCLNLGADKNCKTENYYSSENNEYECYTKCPENTYIDEENKKCLSTCPKYKYHEKNSKICIKPSECQFKIADFHSGECVQRCNTKYTSDYMEDTVVSTICLESCGDVTYGQYSTPNNKCVNNCGDFSEFSQVDTSQTKCECKNLYYFNQEANKFYCIDVQKNFCFDVGNDYKIQIFETKECIKKCGDNYIKSLNGEFCYKYEQNACSYEEDRPSQVTTVLGTGKKCECKFKYFIDNNSKKHCLEEFSQCSQLYIPETMECVNNCQAPFIKKFKDFCLRECPSGSKETGDECK